MIEVKKTAEFEKWLSGLKDYRARDKIALRVLKVGLGQFGDAKFFKGIGELRIDYGPGYRAYFVKRGDVIVILLCGGDKKSQAKDIARALEMAKEV